MINFSQDGEIMDFANSSGSTIASGAIVAVGGRCGVALVDIADGSSGAVQLCGVFNVGKTTSQAWTQGQDLFFVSGTGKLSSAASGNTYFGKAFVAAGSSDTTGYAMLSPFPKQAGTVAALSQVTSGTYVQAEVQAIATKVDAILTSLKASGLMA
jgi:predicted RecA/RadA family phage recombinase